MILKIAIMRKEFLSFLKILKYRISLFNTLSANYSFKLGML